MPDHPSARPQSTATEAELKIVRFMRTRNSKLRADEEALRANAMPGVVFDAADDGLENKLARRNQVLYCLGHIDSTEFRYSDVEQWLRERFPESNKGQVLNVTTALAELAEGGIVMSNPTADAYMLSDAVLRTALRNLLHCAEGSETAECRVGS